MCAGAACLNNGGAGAGGLELVLAGKRFRSDLVGGHDPQLADGGVAGAGGYVCDAVGDVLGGDAARLDEANPHVPPGDFLTQGLGEAVHAELGEAVDAVAVPGDAAGDRADVDDVGAPARALFGGLQQVRQGGAGGVEQALDVDGDHAVPFLRVRAGDGAQEHQAGIVDQDVQSPELPGGLLDGRFGLGAVGDVRFDGQRGPARVLDAGGEGLQA